MRLIRKESARVRINTGSCGSTYRWVEITVRANTQYGLARKISRLKGVLK